MSGALGVVGDGGDPHVRRAIRQLLVERSVSAVSGSITDVLNGASPVTALVLCLDPHEVPLAVERAVASGVERFVLLSSASAPFERGVPADQQWFLPAEQVVEHSGLEWTIIRPVGLMTAALSWADDVRAERTVRHPFGGTAYPHVHEIDVAQVAVTAALDTGHHGARYTVSGPTGITPIEQTAALAEALGAELAFVDLSPQEAAQRWAAAGWSPVDIDLELMLLADFADRPPRPRDTVERVVGRPALPFAAWAVLHADDFR